MAPSKKKHLLFVHSTGPTHVHGRDKDSVRRIRRHVMEDIGESRRKPQRNPQHVVTLRPFQPIDNLDLQDLKLPATPFWSQDPLSILDEQWPMDMFSAYGISLLATEGKRLLGNADALGIEGFSFPFAFTSSAFLQHYGAMFSNQSMVKSIHKHSSARIKVMALERSSETIACIDATLANPDVAVATGDRVVTAVLAVICYNLLDLEFHQARIHIEGLGSLIATRGGVLYLSPELRLMIFWLDVTTSLLFNTRPRYPVPMDLIPPPLESESSNDLPRPLARILAADGVEIGEQLGHIPSCMSGLSRLAAVIESALTARGDALWKDEIFLGLRLNPLVHCLLEHTVQETGFSSHLVRSLAAIRLGMVVWIILVKRMSRAWPGSPMAYIPELLDMLTTQSSWATTVHSSTFDNVLTIRLWLSALCGIASASGTLERKTALKLMVHDMKQLNGLEWSDFVRRIMQMPWIRSFDEFLIKIKYEI